MTIIVTILFLLSSGAPASHAYVICDDVAAVVAGDDAGESVTGAPLVIDSRGALVLTSAPMTVTCFASHQGESWQGPIVLSKAERVVRVYLKEDS